jgi:hypothetical protein
LFARAFGIRSGASLPPTLRREQAELGLRARLVRSLPRVLMLSFSQAKLLGSRKLLILRFAEARIAHLGEEPLVARNASGESLGVPSRAPEQPRNRLREALRSGRHGVNGLDGAFLVEEPALVGGEEGLHHASHPLNRHPET